MTPEPPTAPIPAPEPLPAAGSGRLATAGGLVYAVVVAFTVVGLCLVAFGPWRRGIVVVGIGFLFAAGMRVVVNEGEAGLLRVRGRWFDVAALAGVGITLIVLASNIPDQPGLG